MVKAKIFYERRRNLLRGDSCVDKLHKLLVEGGICSQEFYKDLSDMDGQKRESSDYQP